MYAVRMLMLLSVLLLTKSTNGADTPLIVTGRVVTPAGGPWDGVKVQLLLIDGPKESIVSMIITDSEGAFQLAGSQRGAYRVKLTPWKEKIVLIPLGNQSPGSKVDLGVIKIMINCSDPGVFCDEIKPRER